MTLTPEKKIINQRYECIEILGRGATAITWKAVDHDTDHVVAVKELPISRIREWKDLEQFEREARALAELSHPKIPKFYDHVTVEDQTGTTVFLVQEYIEGETLQEQLDSGKRFDEEYVRWLAVSILNVLDYLHNQNPSMIHRDIKPGNIMIRPDETPVLIDFGAVRDAMREQSVGGSTVVGTYGYMPPEQFAARHVQASDVYALGATMVHLLSGKEPSDMPVDVFRLQFEEFVDVSPKMARILRRMLEPDVEKRYQSAREVLADLDPPRRVRHPQLSEPKSKGRLRKQRQVKYPLPSPQRAIHPRDYVTAYWSHSSVLGWLLPLIFFFPAIGSIWGIVLWVLFGLPPLRRNYAEGKTRLRLMRHGDLGVAEVTEIASRSHHLKVSYRYEFNETIYNESIWTRKSAIPALLGPSSRVPVYVNPHQPEENFLDTTASPRYLDEELSLSLSRTDLPNPEVSVDNIESIQEEDEVGSHNRH